MKKSILAIVLAIATLVTFIVPASAWSWITDGKCEVASYKASLIKELNEDGTSKIVLDGEMDSYYRDNGGDKIVHYEDEEPWKRGNWNSHPDIQALADARFEAYIAVDPNGMYIYAEIMDETLFEEDRDGNANEGDMLQIYIDWCEPNEDPMLDMMHPSAKAMYNQYLLEGVEWESSFDYRNMYGSNGMMYLGWVAGDYHEVVTTAWGFSPYQSLGLDGDKAIQYAAKTFDTDDGWQCEWFIPWREESQGERIARGEQFHCGVGFQAADDSDLYDVVDYMENEKPMPEKSVGIRFDQRKELGLSYYVGYAKLADIIWGEYPENYFGADEMAGIEVDTSDSVIAIVAALGVAGAGVVLFSKKRKED